MTQTLARQREAHAEAAWQASLYPKICELETCTNIIGAQRSSHTKYCTDAHKQAAYHNRRRPDAAYTHCQHCGQKLPVNRRRGAKYCGREHQMLAKNEQSRNAWRAMLANPFFDDPRACYEVGKYRDVPAKWITAENEWEARAA